MEDNLESAIKVEQIARQAYMSPATFYRMFFAITGYSVKDYLLRRRIACASVDLCHGRIKVIDVAMKYAYNSVDAFSRIFRKVTGYTPSACAQAIYQYRFEVLNVLDKYFEAGDQHMLEQYPDIKIINSLPPMRVASYCYYGKTPESGAFAVIKEWVLKQGIDYKNEGYRIFGYNAPDTDASAEEYGYEVCITIPCAMEIVDERIRVKTLSGGRYAVVAIKPCENLGEEIMRGWQRFAAWLDGSPYLYGEAQWLEEHLGFGEKFEHLGGVDLYMPIAEKTHGQAFDCAQECIAPFTAATYTATGRGAEVSAKKYLFSWVKESGLDLASDDIRVFATYNFERINTSDFVYKLCITIPHDLCITDGNIEKETVEGGLFLARRVKYKQNGQSWFNFMSFIERSDVYTFTARPFMEEYAISSPEIDGETTVVQHMAVERKQPPKQV